MSQVPSPHLRFPPSKDEILHLRQMGVDGCLGSGAIQDHLVGFHLMTIFTDQSHISKVIVLSQVS